MGIEDDTFEAKLGLIFKVGLRENKVRMEKEEQFEQKVKAVLRTPKSQQGASAKPQVPHSTSQPSLQPQLPLTSSFRSQGHSNSFQDFNNSSKERGYSLKMHTLTVQTLTMMAVVKIIP